MIQRIVVTDQNIIGIRDFMSKYLEIPYEGSNKLTHYEMEQYLMEKGKCLPTRVNLKNVDREKINNGTYIVVREETKRMKKGKKLIYENPKLFSPRKLLDELINSCDTEKLKQTREKLLKNKGFIENHFGDIVEISLPEEQYTVNKSVNRQKSYVVNRGRHLKRRIKY